MLQGIIARRYEIIRKLGRGGSATVYLARDLRVGGEVALKILHSEFSTSQVALRFAREIRLMAGFHHANILPVLDSGEWSGRPFYVMLYVEGETLEQRLVRQRRLPVADVLDLARGVGAALEYAHAHKVVHRDVKPSNILLSGTHAYLSDFGIAKALEPEPDTPRTSTGIVVGTRAYMSPEQASADAELDGRSDIYSLGCVLFEALSGQHPFHSADEARTWAMRFSAQPDSLRRHREAVPEHVDTAVMRALAREPADRWQSARELVESLGVQWATPSGPMVVPEATGRSSEGPLTRPSDAPAPAVSRWRAWRWIAGAAFAVAAAWSIVTANTAGRDRCTPNTAAATGRRIALIPLARPMGEETGAPDSMTLAAATVLRRTATHWKDVVVDQRPPSSDVAYEQACSLLAQGATRVLAYSVTQAGEGVLWTGTLYRSGTVGGTKPNYTEQKYSIASAGTLAGLEVGARSFVQRALAGSGEHNPLLFAATMTDVWEAWDLFAAARQAIDSGHLAVAESLLTRAAVRDSEFGPVQLWRSALGLWRDGSLPSSSGATIVDTTAFTTIDVPFERDLSLAIGRLLHRDFPGACAAFVEAQRVTRGSIIARLGRGDCLAYDDIVIDDGRPARLRFRSSYSEAIEQYRQGLAMCRAEWCAVVFARIERAAPEMASVRSGARASGGAPLAALQEWRDGHFAHSPILLRAILEGRPGSVPSTLGSALDWARKQRLDLATTWLQREPESADGHRAMSRALELRGLVMSRDTTARGPEARSALGEIGRALRLGTNHAQRLAYTLDRARLLLRASAFDSAARLADSLLLARRSARGGVGASLELAGLATAVGRSRVAAEVLREVWLSAQLRPNGAAPLPLEVLTPASDFMVLSALGVCGDTLRALEREIRRGIEIHLPLARRSLALREVVSRPLLMSAGCDDFKSATRADDVTDPLLRVQRLAAEGKFSAVRERLTQLRREQIGVARTDVALDFVLQECLLRRAAGDTLEATRTLADALGGITSSNSFSLAQLSQAAALGRGRLLLAAWGGGDGVPTEPQVLRSEIAALWSGADVVVRQSWGMQHKP